MGDVLSLHLGLLSKVQVAGLSNRLSLVLKLNPTLNSAHQRCADLMDRMFELGIAGSEFPGSLILDLLDGKTMLVVIETKNRQRVAIVEKMSNGLDALTEEIRKKRIIK